MRELEEAAVAIGSKRLTNVAIVVAIVITIAALFIPPTVAAQPDESLPLVATLQPAQFRLSQQNYAGAVEAEEHRLFPLAVEANLPEGVEVVNATWRVPPGVDYQTTNPLGTEAIATGRPSPVVDGVLVPYRIEYQAQIAQVGLIDVELPDGTKAKKRVAVLPFVTINQTWQVTIRPRAPPTDEPGPEDPPATTTGPKSSAIIYDPLGGPPPEADSAAIELRESGEIVFFVSAEAETGTGATPGFLASAIAKAKEVGLPAVVIMAGSKVKSATPMPSTKAAIVEAIKGS